MADKQIFETKLEKAGNSEAAGNYIRRRKDFRRETICGHSFD
ncbi:MAG TPA: hypothetical protein VGD05_04120 [Pyrinomonadaceae bacterium]|jgi:hypothetical protein